MEDFDKFGVSPALIQEVSAKLAELALEKNVYSFLEALGSDENGGSGALVREGGAQSDTPPNSGTLPTTNRKGVSYIGRGNLQYIGVITSGAHRFYCGIDGQTSILVYGSAVSDGMYAALNIALEQSKKEGVPQLLKYRGSSFMVAPPHGGQKIGFSYRLIFPGIEILLHRSPSERIPLAKVVFGWQSVDKGNVLAITSEIMGWLEDMGSALQGYHITRLDLQCTGDFDILPFIRAAEDDRFVSSQRKKTTVSQGLFVQTLTIGTYNSPVMLRIYDKLQEMVDSPDATKEAQIMGRFRKAWKASGAEFGEISGKPINRVEFSCKREFLRVWGIDTFDDLLEKVTSLVYFLTHNWLRFTVPTQDQNIRRAPMLPEWQEVGSMFCGYFWGGCSDLQRVPEKESSAFLSDEQRRKTRATISTLLAKLIADTALRENMAPRLAGYAVINDVRDDAILDAVSLVRGVLRQYGDVYSALSCD